MYRKALSFGDEKVATQILATDNAAEIKALGRLVSGYDESLWNGIRQIVVYEGLFAKFTQNPDLRERLKDTGNAFLAECAVNDRFGALVYPCVIQADLTGQNGKAKIYLVMPL